MTTKDWMVIREADLIGEAKTYRRKGIVFKRYVCHLHGGDHQRSLSICAEGDGAGFGQCFNCDAHVIVEEWNPKAAWNVGQPSQERLFTPARGLRAAAEVFAPSPPEEPSIEAQYLLDLYPRMRAKLAEERPRQYLAERAIPWELADALGLGYIPAEADFPRMRRRDPSEYWSARQWRDRLVFPVSGPNGLRSLASRSLHHWHPGMDENDHKALLDAKDRPAEEVVAWGPRWLKPPGAVAGWFDYTALLARDGDGPLPTYTIVVEGAFDRLALLTAFGLASADALALAAKEIRFEWLPWTLRGVVLALDGDARGQEAMQRQVEALRERGLHVVLCPPPDDGLGKDWSERWRRGSHAGLEPVLDALDRLAVLLGKPVA